MPPSAALYGPRLNMIRRVNWLRREGLLLCDMYRVDPS